MTISCNDLPNIHWWTSKKRVITAIDGCRWEPYYMLYPLEQRDGMFHRSGFWTWVPVYTATERDMV